MATQTRAPTFFQTYRRPYAQIDPVPNLTAEPFPHIAPFIQEHLSTDVTYPKKWAQDFNWAGTTTIGIPVQPATLLQFRAPYIVPIFSRPRLQPDPQPNLNAGLYALTQPAPPFIPPLFPEFPRKADRDFQSLQVLSYLPGPVIAPYIPVEFPTPMRARATPQDFIFQSTGIPPAAPFVQNDWPIFVRARTPHQDFIWTGTTTQGIPSVPPFNPVEYPNPVRAKAVPQDFTWGGYTTRNIPSAPPPFFQTDFPPTAARTKQAYSDSYESPQILLITPVLKPFLQNEWQEVFRREKPTYFDVWTVNWNLFPPALTPATGRLVMPNLVGLNIWEAIALLQSVGIFVPAKIGYFGTFPISVLWNQQLPNTPKDLAQDFIVSAQSLAAGLIATVNQRIILTVYQPATGVVFP